MRIVLMALAALAAACTTAAQRAPEPMTITLERTLCFGACPDYSVTIAPDGAVTYVGRRFVGVTGEQHGAASHDDLARLTQMINAADFFNLQDVYRAQVTDLPSFRVTVAQGDRRKTVVDYMGESVGMPHAVTEIEQEIDRVAGTARWVQGAARPGTQ